MKHTEVSYRFIRIPTPPLLPLRPDRPVYHRQLSVAQLLGRVKAYFLGGGFYRPQGSGQSLFDDDDQSRADQLLTSEQKVFGSSFREMLHDVCLPSASEGQRTWLELCVIISLPLGRVGL